MSARRGFANPEYLLTLTALLLALAIIVPAVAKARARARNLRALRSVRAALERYAADTKTKGPPALADLAEDGRYLPSVPAVELVGLHARSSRAAPPGVDDDAGGWTYANWPGSPRQGEVWINCTHTDSRGKAWNAY